MSSNQKNLTKLQLNRLLKCLEEKRDQLMFSDSYEPEEFRVEERSDALDQASADSSNASRLRFRNREIFYLKKLNKAIDKVNEGTYGYCEECDVPISYERMMARPTADMCIECKEESERFESSTLSSRKSKSLGEAINLVSQL